MLLDVYESVSFASLIAADKWIKENNPEIRKIVSELFYLIHYCLLGIDNTLSDVEGREDRFQCLGDRWQAKSST